MWAPFQEHLLSVYPKVMPESVGHVYTMVIMVLVYLQTGLPNVMELFAGSMHEKCKVNDIHSCLGLFGIFDTQALLIVQSWMSLQACMLYMRCC